MRLQSSPPHLYRGPLDCFRQSLAREGIQGLYRGVSAPLVGAAVETSSLFWSYRVAQAVLTSFRGKSYAETVGVLQSQGKEGQPAVKLGLGALCVCGALSGAFTSLLLTPIELVKCQMQVPLSSSSANPVHNLTQRQPGPLSVIASVFRHHGLFGFWHGQLGTLIRETGGSAAWFGAYESVGAGFRQWNTANDIKAQGEANPTLEGKSALKLWQQLLAGAAAGVVYNFVFFPADTIKSRMQTQEVNPIDLTGRAAVSEKERATAELKNNKSLRNARYKPKRATFWAIGKGLWLEQGIRGLYRGCGITVARAAPSSAVIFAVYEGLRGWD